MSALTTFVNFIAGLGTLAGFVVIALLIYVAAAKKPRPLFDWIKRRTLSLSFAFAALAVLGSLYYSNVAGFPPCTLCWWQRVFMFPTAILLGLAYWKKNTRMVSYTFVLSILGGLVALYQTYIQYGGSEFIACASGPGAVSCTARYVYEFGFITIPLMALVAFGILIVLGVIHRRS